MDKITKWLNEHLLWVSLGFFMIGVIILGLHFIYSNFEFYRLIEKDSAEPTWIYIFLSFIVSLVTLILWIIKYFKE